MLPSCTTYGWPSAVATRSLVRMMFCSCFIVFGSLRLSPLVALACASRSHHIWLGHSISLMSSASRVGASACAETMHDTAS